MTILLREDFLGKDVKHDPKIFRHLSPNMQNLIAKNEQETYSVQKNAVDLNLSKGAY